MRYWLQGFSKTNLQTKKRETLAREILGTLTISGIVRSIHINNVRSPWEEKVEKVKGTGEDIDIRLNLWDADDFLRGRIYRLFLYVHDSLDDQFQYDPLHIPHGTLESKIRETYNHIWGIYVDSRVEKTGIEAFFDRTLRRNLFIDSQKNLPWTISDLLFTKLWNKERYTHSEMIDYARHLDKLSEGEDDPGTGGFEMEIGKSLAEHSAHQYVDNIISNNLREIAQTILQFVTSHCRGTLVESSSYGIYFMYDQEIFMEMAATKTDELLLTIFDFQSSTHRTYTVKEHTDEMNIIQSEIKVIYDKIANHSRLKVIKDPYTTPVEK